MAVNQNAGVRETLCNEVLQTEKRNSARLEEQKSLDAVSHALAETTSLDGRQIRAVRAELQDQVAAEKQILLIKLPKVNPQYVRIALFIGLGLLGYSAFLAAQINTVQEEQFYTDNMNHAKFDLQIAVGNTRSFLADPYRAHYKMSQSMPGAVEDLDSTYRTIEFLDASNLFTDYQIFDEGTIRLKLSEAYGYNRWIELTPSAVVNPEWHVFEFSCRTNAERHLLYNNGSEWCEHSSSQFLAEALN